MKDRKRILLVLPRGEAIRNFIYSGVSDLLSEKYDVYILSVVPNQEVFESLKSKAKEVYELKPVRVNRLGATLSELLDITHGRWLWSQAAIDRWKFRNEEARLSFSSNIKRLAKKNFAGAFASRKGIRLLSNMQTTVLEKYSSNKYYTDLLKKIKPDLVFNGSHVHNVIARPVLHAARKLGIKTATFLFSWDNLTSQGRIIPPQDEYLVWNDNIKKQFLEIYDEVPEKKVYVAGTPQFDFHFDPSKIWSREEYCKYVGADPSRPIILYTTGMANHLPEEQVIIERIADMLKDFTQYGPPQLVVRVYPKDLTNRFDGLKASRKDILFPKIPWVANWLTPLPEDLELLPTMLYHADIGINVASTISLELCMFDKPVINVAYRPPVEVKGPVDYMTYYTRYYEYEHYVPIVNSGAISVARKEEDVKEFLAMYLANPTINSANRKQLIKDFFKDTLDGKAYQRIANRLMEITEQA